MQNPKPIFLTNLLLVAFLCFQSINSQADTIELAQADSLFDQRSFQEAMSLYQKNYQEGVYSPAMLLKMAFIAEGMKDNENATLYLGKYYDINPDPQIITKIETLTKQKVLEGYDISDSDRFLIFLSENDQLIILGLSALLLFSMILVVVNVYRKTKTPVYWPTILLMLLLFFANNFLSRPNSGLITHSPTLILSDPTGAGELIQRVEPGHKVKIKGSNDIWYKIEWKGNQAYVKKSNVTKL